MHDPSSELAARLLDVVSEPELDAFVGRLVAETAGTGRASRRTGRALAASLRRDRRADAADADRRARRRGRPAGPAATRRPRPGCSALELEGMSPEDRDFEIARRFVRFAQAATAQARATR